MKKFPDGFYWGAATASYQVEGGIENTDWAAAARDGRVPVCGRACDHYHRYESDFDIAKELGHNAHRFSVEWARIEPVPGEFDAAAIRHYREVLKALHARKMTPFITLWHFTLPLWFSESGGFERKDAPEIFARYCAYVVRELGDLCTHFATLNEPNVYATHGWLYGAWPPFKQVKIGRRLLGKQDGTSASAKAARLGHLLLYHRVTKQLAASHVAAYHAIKRVRSDVQIGLVKHVHHFTADKYWRNRLKARIANYFQTHLFMKSILPYCDEIGLNYYRHTMFGDNKNYIKTDMDWDANPGGICDALLQLARYKKPLYVSEAGLADADDDLRATYIQLQVHGVEKALALGVPVHGHLYWSLLDNYEWALGFEKRFGLVAIDYDTLARTIRPSAYVYKEICLHNGLVE
jgi:beta-glucosidase